VREAGNANNYFHLTRTLPEKIDSSVRRASRVSSLWAFYTTSAIIGLYDPSTATYCSCAITQMIERKYTVNKRNYILNQPTTSPWRVKLCESLDLFIYLLIYWSAGRRRRFITRKMMSSACETGNNVTHHFPASTVIRGNWRAVQVLTHISEFGRIVTYRPTSSRTFKSN